MREFFNSDGFVIIMVVACVAALLFPVSSCTQNQDNVQAKFKIACIQSGKIYTQNGECR